MQIKSKRKRFRNWHEPSRYGFSHCHKQQGSLAKIYLQNATQFCYFNLVPSPTCRLRVCLNCSRYKPTQVHSLHVCRRIILTKKNQKEEKHNGVSLPPRTFVSTLPNAALFRILKQTLPFSCALKLFHQLFFSS